MEAATNVALAVSARSKQTEILGLDKIIREKMLKVNEYAYARYPTLDR